MNDKTALIIVDPQNDFALPDGALSVPEGHKAVNGIVTELLANGLVYDVIVTTQDTHPANHCSFKENGGIWPTHCVVDTHGYEIHEDINDALNQLTTNAEGRIETIQVHKANDPNKDAYSGFDGTDLAETLRDYGVNEVYICGFATDYCVKATAIDAVKEGFLTNVIMSAIRGVSHDTTQDAIIEMIEEEINLVN